MTLEIIHIEPYKFKARWSTEEIQFVVTCLNEHFESHDDWTDAATDMNLIYRDQTERTGEESCHASYASLVVTGGDFYAMAGILIRGFALTDEFVIILIGEDDSDSNSVYYIID